MKKQLFFVFVVIYSVVFSQQKADYLIASGSRGGNYYQTGKYIASRYSKTLTGNFTVLETNGSNENIDLLKNNLADFAIVQRNILLNSIYDEENGTKNIEIIAPLFQEKLQIYFHGKQSINIRELDSLSSIKKIVVGFTSKEGYSYKVFKTLTKFLNINYANFSEKEKNYDSLLVDFNKGKIDFVVSFSLPLQAFDTLKNVNKVFLNKHDAKMIQQRLRNVYATPIGNDNQYSLGSWSFLVGVKSVIAEIPAQKKLMTSLTTDDAAKANMLIHNRIKTAVNQFVSNKNKESELLRNIPLSTALQSEVGISATTNWQPYIMLLAVVFLIFALHYYYKGRWFPKINLLYFWNRYKHFQLGFVILIIIYFASVELLIYAEKLFYKDIGIKSQILNMTRPDLHSWLLVTTVTGNSNGIFPLSLLGKVMLSLNSLNFWIGTILIGVSELITYRLNKKRKKGLMKTKYNNHLVIFGWNGSTNKFISEILTDAEKYNNKKIRIVCVVPDIAYIRSTYEEIEELQDQKIIDIIEGDARDSHTLEKANVQNANSIILLSEDNTKRSDERILLRAMAISRYTKRKNNGRVYKTTGFVEKIKDKFLGKKKEKDADYKKYRIEKTTNSAYMIAEINNDEFRESLIEADVNEIVVAGNYRKSIMKQSLFNHGISKVLDEIMQYNDYNEFYKIDLSLKENAHLRNKTFDQLLVALRQQGILLVAIHIIFHDENDRIIIDQNVIKELLEKEEKGILRDVIVNPYEPAERERLTDSDDHLIVLAINANMLKEAVSKVKF